MMRHDATEPERASRRRGPAIAALRRFLAAESASVSVDFVVSIPILLAVLVLTSEYGRVLQMRASLGNAVADAARYLSRVPLDETGAAFPPEIVAIAQGLVTSRVNTPHLAVSAPELGEAGDFRTVRIAAAAGVATPALGILTLFGPARTADGLEVAEIEGLIITASETVRHFGR